jgi:hypothetical protein
MNEPIQAALADDLRKVQTFTALTLLTLEEHKWLLPQAEIRLLGSPLDIDQEVRVPHSIGAIAFENEWWPVYCLSGELRLLPQPSTHHRVCLLLSNGADRFGVVCDRVESLTESPRLAALPACMALPDSPIQALVLFQGGLGCLTTTERLAALIATIAEKADG